MASSLRHNPMLRPILRGWPLILLTCAAAVAAARWYLDHTVPMYESTAKIRLADPHTGEASANLYKDLDVFSTNNQIGTEVEMVRAKVLIDKTLDSIDMQTIVYRLGKLIKKELYRDDPVKVSLVITDERLYGRSFILQVFDSLRYRVSLPDERRWFDGFFDRPLELRGASLLISRNSALLEQRTDMPLAGRYAIVRYSRDQAADKIISGLDITSIDKDVPILRIIYKSAVPEKASDFVNILAAAYISDYVETKVRAADITVAFLDRQLSAVARRLAHSEDTVENYRNGEHIINIHQETETDLRKIAQLKIQLANLQMSLAAIDTLDHYMQTGNQRFLELAPNFEAFTDLLSTELIKKLKQLQSDKKDLLTRFTEEDEKVMVIDEKIKDIRDYLLESIKNTRQNYAIKYREMLRTVAESEKVFVGLPKREKNMAILERDFGLNEKIYSYLHQKRTEAQIARAATVSFHRIVAHGEAPEKPVSPNRVVITGVAAILGLFGSTVLIYAIHSAKGKVNDTANIEKRSETIVAAEVRRLTRSAERCVAFNDVAIQLELKKVLVYPCTLVLSSFGSGEGKAYIARHLAEALGVLGRKVLLLDEGASLETGDGVVIRENLERKLQQWRADHDIIIIRNEPMIRSGNALVLMSLADVNLFVLDARKTPARRILEADILKETYQLPGMRYVLNRAHYNPGLLLQVWRYCRRWRRTKTLTTI